MSKIKDSTVIKFGKHKGKTFENVPAEYLLFLGRSEDCSQEIRDYIDENFDVLMKEIE
jgi:uncharacterized protein (DUF3820 family)